MLSQNIAVAGTFIQKANAFIFGQYKSGAPIILGKI
jgi:hypothetical protein